MAKSLKVMIVAGEPSGDLLGAGLMGALRKACETKVTFVGIGGEEMAKEGLLSLFPLSDLSVMGIAEVLPRLFLLLRRIRETVELAKTERPDVLVTIDSPGFSFRIAAKIKAFGIPIVHYVAPHVWAWRPGRAKKMPKYIDHLLALLPFEPPFFEPYGMSCTFVGHPVATRIAARQVNADPVAFSEKYDLPVGGQKLLLLPGSRMSEVSRLLPEYRRVWQSLYQRSKNLTAIIPVVPSVTVAIEEEVATWPGQVVLVHDRGDHGGAFSIATAALAASGTAILELALSRVPTVACYKTGAITAFLVRGLIKTPYLTLPNLLLEREAIPEFLQENCDSEKLTTAVERLLNDETSAAEQISNSAQLYQLLGGDDPNSPSERAAHEILAFLERRRAS
jgi:lipid-A-disaccharide synthase